MELTQELFEKINELEEIIMIVESISKILFEYDGEKEILVDILFEKTSIMKNTLDDFTSLLIKN